MLRRWSFLPFMNADAGGGSGGGAADAGGAAAAGDAGGAAAGDAGGGSAAATVTRPEGLPEDLWDATAGAPKVDDLVKRFGDLAKFKGDHDARLSQRPEKPDAYAADLPKDFQVPQGMEFKVDPADPLLQLGRQIAHEAGLSQDEFTAKLVAPYAKHLLEQQRAAATAEAERRAAEVAKLGENASARLDTVTSWLKANLSGEEGEALAGVITSAAAVQAVEKLITLAGGPQVQAGGQGGGGEALSPVEYFKELFKNS